LYDSDFLRYRAILTSVPPDIRTFLKVVRRSNSAEELRNWLTAIQEHCMIRVCVCRCVMYTFIVGICYWTTNFSNQYYEFLYIPLVVFYWPHYNVIIMNPLQTYVKYRLRCFFDLIINSELFPFFLSKM